MIVVQTPLRVSFLGGGTDFRQYFSEEGGCVLNGAIDKYIFVLFKRRLDRKIRLSYTRPEVVERVDDLQHDLVRECLRRAGLSAGVEIATMSDIPSEGTGLGSSSSLTVGLLNAMYTYLGATKDPHTLAHEACEIEIEVLGKPIGVQDQYIAAYGGLRFMRFKRDGEVSVQSLDLDEPVLQRLNQELLLFYTRRTRRAESVLAEQLDRLDRCRGVLRELQQLAVEGRESLTAADFERFGLLLHKGWNLKKRLARQITNDFIDQAYQAAREAGALGGKISGAGGGGFLLLYCPQQRQDRVRQALSTLHELPFRLKAHGSKVLLNRSTFGEK